jgi:RHS repeat-associated protein
MGWSLSGLSAISRCLPSFTEEVQFNLLNYDVYDRYCLDGQRMSVVSGGYSYANSEYRVGGDPFTKITANGHVGPYADSGPESFTVMQKNGLRYDYGVTPDSRLESAGAEGVFSWLLNKVTDRFGNFYTITYQKDLANGEVIPLRIDYTGNAAAGLQTFNSVQFEYEPMPIIKTRYVGGQVYKIQNRLSKVKMHTGPTKVWEFRLSFTSDSVRNASLLSSVQECDAQNICMPPTTFGWGDDTAAAHNFTPGPFLNDMGIAQGQTNSTRYPIITGDWNGDGRTDIARVHGQNTRFYISTASGYQLFNNLTTSLPLFNNDNDGLAFPLVAGDWNGDGRTDVMRANLTATGNQTLYYFYTSTPTGFAPYLNISRNSLSASANCAPSPGDYGKILVGDWNADGRSDVGRVGSYDCTSFMIWIWAGTDYRSSAPQLGSAGSCTLAQCPYFTGDWNGDGITDIARVLPSGVAFYAAGQSIHSPFHNFYHITTPPFFSPAQGYTDVDTYPVLVGDWNGDGLSDFGRIGSGSVQLCMAVGQRYPGPTTSFTDCFTTPFPSAPSFPNNTNYPVVVGDWNNDGTSDIARVHSGGVHVYTVREGVPTLDLSITQLSSAQGYGSQFTHPLIVGDWNGDGFSDFARVSQNGIDTSLRAYSDTAMLKEIVNGFGGTTRIDYAPMTDASVYTKGTAGSFQYGADMQGALRVVKRVEVTDDATTSTFLSYSYKGLRYDAYGRNSIGFAEVKTTNELYGNTKTTFYRQDGSGYNAGGIFNGVPAGTETRLTNGTLIHRTQNTWANVTVPPNMNHSYVSLSREDFFEIDGSLDRTITTTTTMDSWGNPSNVTVNRTDGSSEVTVSTYNNNQSAWVIGQLLTSQVTRTGPTAQGSPSSVRRSAFTYNSAGAMLTETTEPGTADQLVKSYIYDQFGNLTQTTVSGAGITSRTSTTTYDVRGRFPLVSTNPLGQSETRTYSESNGKPLTIRDPNGIVVSMSYDSFGRERLVTNPDGTLKRTLYLQADPLTAPANASYAIRVDASGAAPQITYFDGLSREIRRETLGFGGQRIFIDRVYDDGSRLIQQSEPYFSGSTPLWTNSQYDEMDRVTGVFEPGNLVTAIDYSPGWTHRYNPLGQATATRVDNQGRTVERIDANDEHSYFKYDAYGNMTHVTDSIGNVTVTTYNNRGYKTSIVDPDSGTTTFTNNVLGELLQQVNANGQTITLTYDLLGRLVQRNSPEGVESWVYDTARMGVGKLHRVFGLNGYIEEYSYDSLGRSRTSSWTINAVKFISSQSYNANGAVSQVTYPSGFGVKYQFNVNGYLSDVRRADNNASVWTALQANARGQIESQRYGNNLVSTKVFNPQNGLLQSVSTGVNGSVQNLAFQFDAIGNLTRRDDLRIGLYEDFIYDDLNRLTSSQVVGQAVKYNSYDELGNITWKTGVGTYYYAAGKPHAVSSIVGAGANSYTYDAAGNRLTSVGGSVTYNSTSKPTSITKGTSTLQFKLAPDYERYQQRVIKNGAVVEDKLYIGKNYEEVTISGVTSQVHYIYAGSDSVATFTIPRRGATSGSFAGKMRYLHKDHLGSIQSITNDVGAIVETLSFSPWGERRDPYTWGASSAITSIMDRGFTGHEHLDEVSLVHMNGRVYDPVIGRFISADPFVQDPENMQSLNRYSYVNNNPLSYVDPSGYFLKGFFKKVAKFFQKNLPMIISTLVMLVSLPTGNAIGIYLAGAIFEGMSAGFVAGIASGISGVITGLASSVAGTLAAGGKLSAGLKAGVRSAHFAFLSAFTANIVGTIMNPGMAKAIVHGVTNGAIGAAQGEDFLSSFASSFAGSIGGTNIITAALAGGTAAALTGGKFSQGVLRSAIIHLYNEKGIGHENAKNKDSSMWGGTRWLAINVTADYPYGTVGYEVHDAVSNFYDLMFIGDFASGAIGQHYSDPEVARLMSLPATAKNIEALATHETKWWWKQPGLPGLIGMSVPASGRAAILRRNITGCITSESSLP